MSKTQRTILTHCPSPRMPYARITSQLQSLWIPASDSDARIPHISPSTRHSACAHPSLSVNIVRDSTLLARSCTPGPVPDSRREDPGFEGANRQGQMPSDSVSANRDSLSQLCIFYRNASPLGEALNPASHRPPEACGRNPNHPLAAAARRPMTHPSSALVLCQFMHVHVCTGKATASRRIAEASAESDQVRRLPRHSCHSFLPSKQYCIVRCCTPPEMPRSIRMIDCDPYMAPLTARDCNRTPRRLRPWSCDGSGADDHKRAEWRPH
ncbi:hypothetical protein PYCCODRAFT_348953 [Trametes coccinea BRFM310]|uniref:Uncharacterized protein n=1 Tax=Trametes coccinea (strain BRFM310) TaxID=1353009 RepID=A0A1Y2J5P4_TRAC3|nr:hypothetical protein PYCCODRAFT_348953 [Trametes coccinea BRFM310]